MTCVDTACGEREQCGTDSKGRQACQSTGKFSYCRMDFDDGDGTKITGLC